MKIIFSLLLLSSLYFAFMSLHYGTSTARAAAWLRIHADETTVHQDQDPTVAEAVEKGNEILNAFVSAKGDLLSQSILGFIFSMIGLIISSRRKRIEPAPPGHRNTEFANQAREATE